MPGNQEYEIKATLDPASLPALHAYPLVAEALRESAPAQMLSTYYDTEACELWRAGFSLRLRKTSDKIVQTLKQAGSSSLERGEWEWTRDDESIGLDELAATPLRPLLDGLAERLAPRFIVDVARTRFDITSSATLIEGALDRGTIQGDGRSLPVCEIELELKCGAPRDVVALARRMIEDLPLVPSVVSKAERGFQLIKTHRTRPQKGLHVPLVRGMPVRTAIEAIVAQCVHAICLNAALIAGAERIEAVHQTRVAVRRLRAALLVFKPTLDPQRMAHLQAELKWIAGLLGAARDCDVHQTDVFDPAAKAAHGPHGSAALAAIMREVQADAHARLAVALTGTRWRHLLLDLVATPLARETPESGDPFEPFVMKRLKGRHRRVAGMAKHLCNLSADERHELRKKAKALRYAYALFEKALPNMRKKAYRRTLKALGTLQETLGGLHDQDALGDVLRAHAQDPASPLNRQPDEAGRAAIFAAGALSERRVRQKALLTKAERALQKIRADVPF